MQPAHGRQQLRKVEWHPPANWVGQFREWFAEAGGHGVAGHAPGAAVAGVLRRSGLTTDLLRFIWGLVDQENAGTVEFGQFCALLRLVSLAQAGTVPSIHALMSTSAMRLPPPSLAGSAALGTAAQAAPAPAAPEADDFGDFQGGTAEGGLADDDDDFADFEGGDGNPGGAGPSTGAAPETIPENPFDALMPDDDDDDAGAPPYQAGVHLPAPPLAATAAASSAGVDGRARQVEQAGPGRAAAARATRVPQTASISDAFGSLLHPTIRAAASAGGDAPQSAERASGSPRDEESDDFGDFGDDDSTPEAAKGSLGGVVAEGPGPGGSRGQASGVAGREAGALPAPRSGVTGSLQAQWLACQRACREAARPGDAGRTARGLQALRAMCQALGSDVSDTAAWSAALPGGPSPNDEVRTFARGAGAAAVPGGVTAAAVARRCGVLDEAITAALVSADSVIAPSGSEAREARRGLTRGHDAMGRAVAAMAAAARAAPRADPLPALAAAAPPLPPAPAAEAGRAPAVPSALVPAEASRPAAAGSGPASQGVDAAAAGDAREPSAAAARAPDGGVHDGAGEEDEDDWGGFAEEGGTREDATVGRGGLAAAAGDTAARSAPPGSAGLAAEPVHETAGSAATAGSRAVGDGSAGAGRTSSPAPAPPAPSMSGADRLSVFDQLVMGRGEAGPASGGEGSRGDGGGVGGGVPVSVAGESRSDDDEGFGSFSGDDEGPGSSAGAAAPPVGEAALGAGGASDEEDGFGGFEGEMEGEGTEEAGAAAGAVPAAPASAAAEGSDDGFGSFSDEGDAAADRAAGAGRQAGVAATPAAAAAAGRASDATSDDGFGTFSDEDEAATGGVAAGAATVPALPEVPAAPVPGPHRLSAFDELVMASAGAAAAAGRADDAPTDGGGGDDATATAADGTGPPSAGGGDDDSFGAFSDDEEEAAGAEAQPPGQEAVGASVPAAEERGGDDEEEDGFGTFSDEEDGAAAGITTPVDGSSGLAVEAGEEAVARYSRADKGVKLAGTERTAPGTGATGSAGGGGDVTSHDGVANTAPSQPPAAAANDTQPADTEADDNSFGAFSDDDEEATDTISRPAGQEAVGAAVPAAEERGGDDEEDDGFGTFSDEEDGAAAGINTPVDGLSPEDEGDGADSFGGFSDEEAGTAGGEARGAAPPAAAAAPRDDHGGAEGGRPRGPGDDAGGAGAEEAAPVPRAEPDEASPAVGAGAAAAGPGSPTPATPGHDPSVWPGLVVAGMAASLPPWLEAELAEGRFGAALLAAHRLQGSPPGGPSGRPEWFDAVSGDIGEPARLADCARALAGGPCGSAAASALEGAMRRATRARDAESPDEALRRVAAGAGGIAAAAAMQAKAHSCAAAAAALWARGPQPLEAWALRWAGAASLVALSVSDAAPVVAECADAAASRGKGFAAMLGAYGPLSRRLTGALVAVHALLLPARTLSLAGLGQTRTKGVPDGVAGALRAFWSACHLLPPLLGDLAASLGRIGLPASTPLGTLGSYAAWVARTWAADAEGAPEAWDAASLAAVSRCLGTGDEAVLPCPVLRSGDDVSSGSAMHGSLLARRGGACSATMTPLGPWVACMRGADGAARDARALCALGLGLAVPPASVTFPDAARAALSGPVALEAAWCLPAAGNLLLRAVRDEAEEADDEVDAAAVLLPPCGEMGGRPLAAPDAGASAAQAIAGLGTSGLGLVPRALETEASAPKMAVAATPAPAAWRAADDPFAGLL